jgi:tetratricopeptide (TPR) repeat protein/uncharacterized caspase-like protein
LNKNGARFDAKNVAPFLPELVPGMYRVRKNNLRTFLLTICLSLLSPYGAHAQANAPQIPTSKSWAVVIGISKYPKLPGGYQLSFADKDALAFAEAIKKVCGDNVRTFINQEATVMAIKEAVGNWLARSTNEADTVYVFFSGHGFYEKEYGESYLLTYDSDANVPYASAISLKELGYAISRRVHARRVLFIADAVRKDYFDPETDDGEASKKFAQALNQIADARSGVSTVLANRGGEFSREGQRWDGHGVFTKYLLDALASGADKNNDGLTNGEEVFDFLAARVAADTSNKQRPSRSGNAIDQIALAKSNNAVAKSPTLIQTPELTKADKPKLVAKVEEPQVPKLEASQPRVKPQEKAAPIQPPSTSSSTPPVSQPVTVQPRPPVATPTPTTTTSVAKSNGPTTAKIEATKSPAASNTTPNPPSATPGKVETATPTAPKVAPKPPPSTKPIQPANPGFNPNAPGAEPTMKAGNVTPPPAPAKTIPKPTAVSAEPPVAAKTQPGIAPTVSTPTTAAPPPSPLILELEAAISTGRLVEPKGNSAWDLYQQLSQQPAAAADAARLKPQLAAALTKAGKEIVSGFALGDTIADRTDDFRRAGQMLLRARTLAPENSDVVALEKLSAAQALIALQFYDEAEKALTLLPKSEATENALGLVFTGRLDYWKAERAFRNAIELKADWAAPHYNLGLLFRAQKKAEALAAFEQAAKLDTKTVALFIALGDEYFSLSQWQPAAEAYRKAVALKPYDDNLHTKLGHALYSQGLRDEANREYQKAKELRSKQ